MHTPRSMTTTLAQTDPRRIACPHCAAPIGAWCMFRNHFGGWSTSDGEIHRKRARAAHRFRLAGRAPAAQLALFGGAQ